MITECYVAGMVSDGKARCAVVITEDVRKNEVKMILHQVAWDVPGTWEYNGQEIPADELNCEILAACYALKWCTDNKKQLVNIYAPIARSQERYYRLRFPSDRTFGDAYKEAYRLFCSSADAIDGEEIRGRVFADWDVNIAALHQRVTSKLLK